MLQKHPQCLRLTGMLKSLFFAGLQSASMFVHGGYNGQHTFSDTHILNTSDWTWQQVSTTGRTSFQATPPPTPMFADLQFSNMPHPSAYLAG